MRLTHAGIKISVSIGEKKDYLMVADKEGHNLKIRKSHVDLGTRVIPEYLT